MHTPPSRSLCILVCSASSGTLGPLAIQVLRGFDGEHLDRELASEQKKRKQDLLQQGLACDSFTSAKRQRAWLGRAEGL
eukprot:3415230-Alexandrium_andersonii.AAC.1